MHFIQKTSSRRSYRAFFKRTIDSERLYTIYRGHTKYTWLFPPLQTSLSDLNGIFCAHFWSMFFCFLWVTHVQIGCRKNRQIFFSFPWLLQVSLIFRLFQLCEEGRKWACPEAWRLCEIFVCCSCCQTFFCGSCWEIFWVMHFFVWSLSFLRSQVCHSSVSILLLHPAKNSFQTFLIFAKRGSRHDLNMTF